MPPRPGDGEAGPETLDAPEALDALQAPAAHDVLAGELDARLFVDAGPAGGPAGRVDRPARRAQQAVLAELGQRALRDLDVCSLVATAVALVAETLDADLVEVLELLPAGDELLVRAGAGWRPGLVGELVVGADPATLAGRALAADAVVVDRAGPTRASPPHLLEHGAVSGMASAIHGATGPYGVFAVHTRQPRRRFVGDERHFLQSVTNVLSAAIQRKATETELHESRERLRLALVSSRMGTWQWDTVTGRLTWDETIESIYGLPPGGFEGRFESFIERVHPDDRSRVLAMIQQSAETGAGHDFEHRIVWPDGTVRWVQGMGRTIRDDEGRPVGMSGLAVDVTERKEAEEALRDSRERLAFLFDASTLLNASLEHDAILAELARLTVPRLADWCLVNMVEADGSLRRVVIAHADPDKAELATRVRQYHEVVPLDDSTGVPHVLSTGRAALHSHLDLDQVAAAVDDEEYNVMLREVGARSIMLVPLAARGHTLGVVTFVAAESGRVYDERDLALAEVLARRAALAVDNARLYEELRFQKVLYESQSEATIDGLLVVDEGGRILLFNQRFVDMWDIPAEVIESRSDAAAVESVLAELVDPAAFTDRIAYLYDHPTETSRDELRLRDGRTYDRYSSPLLGEDGTYLGRAWYFRDITEERRAQKALAQSHERVAALARTLQQSLLPPQLPEIPRLDLAARYLPAGGEIDIAGDFYDLFPVQPGRWGVALGDVCGKGSEAARLTALVRYALRASALHAPSPTEALAVVNEALLREIADEEPRFCTVAFADVQVDTPSGAVMRLASGGHPLPLLVTADGRVRAIGTPGAVLGVFEELVAPTTDVQLQAGDAVVFYTDGLSEARSPDDWFGDERIADILAGVAGRPAESIAQAIEDAVRTFQPGPLRDDLAVLVLRLRG